LTAKAGAAQTALPGGRIFAQNFEYGGDNEELRFIACVGPRLDVERCIMVSANDRYI
jgi:hypothetical protein